MAAAIPVGIMAGKAIYGYVQKRKADKALKAAEAERQGALGGATGIGTQLGQTGTDLTNQGVAAISPAMSYYSALLGGNRAQMAQATAGPRGAITDAYSGAERGLEHSGIRGAGREVATAELGRDKASKIAGLTTGVQPAAAASLTDIGTNLTQQGGQRMNTAGNLWAALLGQGTFNRNNQQNRADDASAQFGSSLFDLLSHRAGAYGGQGQRPRQGQPGWGVRR